MRGCEGAAQVNARLRGLVDGGARKLAVSFDPPTRTGLDSAAPAAWGLVGHRGVPVDSIDDMRVLLGGLPLDRIAVSLAADTCAAPLLVLYRLVAEEHGAPAGRLAGSVGNDALTDLLLSGPGPFPPRASLRLVRDVCAYGLAELPRWRCLTVRGHRLTDAGADPAQEIAFTVAAGTEYLLTAAAAGLDPAAVAARTALCVSAARTGRDTRAKLRAVRRLWARTVHARLGPGPAPRLHTAVPARHQAATPSADGLEAAAAALLDRVARLGGLPTVLEGSRGPELFGVHGTGGPVHHRPRLARPWAASHAVRALQTERLAKLRAWRVQPTVDKALLRLCEAAQGDDNVLHPLRDALASRATLGEVCTALRDTWAASPPVTPH
ncbi:methylmalonyl-CoA mutase family protein [Streptomyces sp. S.PNR 29]|uniref:methylmalonyl-CoA mutase family protein n=1 Tax=Streptomyces sp. S.PNR 29 TaxID=2973805 RepID=UPI0025B23901|nr:methylmalonyl-CoA mutase family protein [Streptomyces sp. S.PNR 29]MDN0195755.1 acyl-CoA mutase large subunit family protein [Streptomyces sp. S.PNR 29]